MLGFGSLGQFALGQASTEQIIAAQFIIDDSASPERRRRRRKEQEDAVAEIAAGRERLRGAIYDAIHPPQIFETPNLDIGIFASKPSPPVVLPGDMMVSAVLHAQMMDQRRQQMRAAQEDEDDIALLLGGQ